MQRRDDARGFSLQTVQLLDRIARAADLDVDSARAKRRNGFLRHPHVSMVASTYDEQRGRIRKHFGQILDAQVVAFAAPPAISHALGKDEHVGGVIRPADPDAAEGIGVHAHELAL